MFKLSEKYMVARFKLEKAVYLDILEVIRGSMRAFIKDEGKIPESVIDPMEEQWIELINRNFQEIYIQTHEKVNKYLNFYNVLPDKLSSDEFKYIYFIGMTVADKLKEEGMVDHARYHLKAILRLLDYRLKDPYDAYRPQLSLRIQKTIDNHKINEHFGEFGWYLLYKCLFNAAKEKSIEAKKDE
ncbi:hypothetical protein NQ807_11965 [Acinetobacter baumannii]|uniref:hypothetical protein n=1 Tax=Acinetobacter soli TaxID=487316 RepID=UPI0023413131|nr:hypothetical protein [Acinetobacter baumannii]